MAASITHSGTLPDSSGKADFYAIIDSATISGIVGTELSKIDTAGKISGKAFTELANIPAGAGVIPAANLPASTSSSEDAITRGFEIDDAAIDDTSIDVLAGVLYHGSTKIAVTSNTTLTFATAADWWDGAADSYAGGAGWCYVGVDSSGNIKLLGANAPDCADSAGNTDGTKYYWYDASLYWRVIGAVKVDTDNKIMYGQIQIGNRVVYDDTSQTNNGLMDNAAATTFTDITNIATKVAPVISGMAIIAYLATTTTYLYLRKNGSSATYGYTIYAGAEVGGQIDVPVDSGGIVEYKVNANTTDLDCAGYVLNIR